jgi:hypothetical protein
LSLWACNHDLLSATGASDADDASSACAPQSALISLSERGSLYPGARCALLAP